MTYRAKLSAAFTRAVFIARRTRPRVPRVAQVAVPLAVVGLIVFVSCLRGPATPHVATNGGTLGLDEEGPSVFDTKEFRVVFASPKGQQRDASEVTIVWNRPMRALELAGEETAPPATIVADTAPLPDGAPAEARAAASTTVEGSWRWMGTSAATFVPRTALPRATPFTVTVPAGTKALDGSTLAKPYVFHFATARPAIVSVEPWDGADGLRPDATFTIRTNQPVDPRELERASSLELEGVPGHARFTASWPDPHNPQLLVVTPSAPLPLATRVSLTIGATLRGMEGPLTVRGDKHATFSTYGPLKVTSFTCSQREGETTCPPGFGLSLSTSNGVRRKDFAAHTRIEPGPQPKWAVDDDDDDSATTWMDVPLALRPAAHYRIVVSAGLTDEHGQALDRDAVFNLQTRDFDPQAVVGVTGSVFEAALGKHDVPVTAVNLGSYDVVTAALDPSALLDYLTTPLAKGETMFDQMAKAPGAQVTARKPTAPRNVDDVQYVDGASLFGASNKGAAVFGIRYIAPGYKVGETRVAEDGGVYASTDLGITGKMSRFGSMIFVSRLSDGEPVANATVSVMTKGRGEVLALATDASGVVTIPTSLYSPIAINGSPDSDSIVVARLGDDWAYQRVSSMLDGYRFGASIDPSGALDPIGMVFTERGVYRPGEHLKGTAIFRVPRARGTETPVGRAVSIAVVDGQGESLFKGKGTLDAFGAVAIDAPLAESAHLGSGNITVTLDATEGSNADSATAGYELAAYRAAEFKVAVDPSQRSFIRGDKAGFTVRGDYLFGAPMGAGKVTYSVTRSNGYFTPPGAESWVVDDSAYDDGSSYRSPRAAKLQDGRGALDKRGTFEAATALSMPGQVGPEIVTVEADVEDVSRQSIAGRTSVIVHPGEFYVAMKPPPDYFVDKGTTIRPEIRALEPSGAARSGVRVHLEAIRRTWSSVLEASGSHGGSGHYLTRPIDHVIASCDVTTGPAPAACNLPLTELGSFIVRATAEDSRRNPIASSRDLYVVGDGGEAGWAVDDTTKLALVADKKEYEVGDTARILVKSPFATADAIVTVERSGIYSQQRLPIRGATPTLRIPITDDMRPNAFVAVHLVRGRTGKPPANGQEQDIGGPTYRLGYAELDINPEARRLKVAVTTAKADYHPGDEVDVDLALTDRAGKGADGEVTFYAVDEGVLMLTGYRTPDPLPTFTAPRQLNVFALESRDDLARAFVSRLVGDGRDKGGQGGGGGGAPLGVRSDFRATAYFAGNITAGADGKAHTRFKLPDNLTTYRLMAVAASSDDRFGYGEGSITTSRPLMARPELPRFLRAGDSIDAGVVISSKGMAAGPVSVTIAARGVHVLGDATKTVDVPENGNVEVRWAIDAPEVGNAVIDFQATGGGEKDAVELKRAVEVPLSPEAVALAGETTNGVDEKLGDFGAVRGDVGGLDVKVASTALIGMGDGAEQLIEYPYGCTEQLTSRMVPLVPLRSLATDFGVKLPVDLDPVIDDAIARVLANQRSDGSFGYWPDSEEGVPWLTAYALFGLDVAMKHGHRVPDAAIDRAVATVRRDLTDTRYPYWREERAFVLDVLASIGRPDPGATTELYDAREGLSLAGRALLAHAMVGMKMDHQQALDLLHDLDAHVRITPTGATIVENAGSEYAPLLDSNTRTTALVLRALVAVNPKNPLLGRLARGLLASRRHGRFGSTQEAAWALLALDDYRHVEEKQVPDFDARVLLGDTVVLAAPFHGRSAAVQTAHLPMDKLLGASRAGAAGQGNEALDFNLAGTGDLYYEARLEYAKKTMPTEGLERGFFVRKVVRAVTPEGLEDALDTVPDATATSAPAGGLVLVDLIVVTSDPREQVVIDDPLPAGLEAVQNQLVTSAQSLSLANRDDDSDDADDGQPSPRSYNPSYFHREIKDDRVLTFVEHMAAGMYHYRYLARATTIGTFVVPPTRAECMYEPETFGRTGAATFEVKAP